VGAPDAGTSTTDPCRAHTDQASCAADGADQCQWFALGIPCQQGAPSCPSGVCQHVPTPPPPGGGCACACPDCMPGQPCPPCMCSCNPSGGCVPPPIPSPPPTGGGSTIGMACPAIGCAQPCPNGYKSDASGCPTCTCL
jgi:hypothetical protein